MNSVKTLRENSIDSDNYRLLVPLKASSDLIAGKVEAGTELVGSVDGCDEFSVISNKSVTAVHDDSVELDDLGTRK